MLAVVLLPISAGCLIDTAEDAAVVSTKGGRCILSQDLEEKICVDFDSDLESGDATDVCDTLKEAFSYNGSSFQTGTDHTCSGESDVNAVGTCEVSYGVINYGDSGWTTESGQSDCEDSQDGTWTDAE